MSTFFFSVFKPFLECTVFYSIGFCFVSLIITNVPSYFFLFFRRGKDCIRTCLVNTILQYHYDLILPKTHKTTYNTSADVLYWWNFHKLSFHKSNRFFIVCVFLSFMCNMHINSLA